MSFSIRWDTSTYISTYISHPQRSPNPLTEFGAISGRGKKEKWRGNGKEGKGRNGWEKTSLPKQISSWLHNSGPDVAALLLDYF